MRQAKALVTQVNQEQFETWLFKQPAERQFATRSVYGCFLAVFLKETTNYKSPCVGWHRWSPNYRLNATYLPGTVEMYSLPQWAKKLTCPKVLRKVGQDHGRVIIASAMQQHYKTLFGDPTVEQK